MITLVALSHVSLREQGLLDLCHLAFTVFLGSGGPASQLLLLGTAIPFSTNHPFCSLISDSGADIAAVSLCPQGPVLSFILAGRMLSRKLSQMLLA